MVLVLTLLIRDEIDIVEGMIDFHLSNGVDQIIVTDNGSLDGTYEVLKEYEKKGNIKLLTEPPSNFSQHLWVSRMANIAYNEFQADWVIHADADELFVPAQGFCLKECLTNVADDTSALLIPRHDFVSINRTMHASPFLEMIYRKTVSLNLKGDPLPPKIAHRGSPNVVISQGNHFAKGDFLARPSLTNKLSVYHYPIRSYQQFYSKVKNAGSGYANNKELNIEQGFHKRYWYDLLLNDKLLDLYDKECLMTPEKIERALKENEIIKDLRIKEYFISTQTPI